MPSDKGLFRACVLGCVTRFWNRGVSSLHYFWILYYDFAILLYLYIYVSVLKIFYIVLLGRSFFIQTFLPTPLHPLTFCVSVSAPPQNITKQWSKLEHIWFYLSWKFVPVVYFTTLGFSKQTKRLRCLFYPQNQIF